MSVGPTHHIETGRSDNWKKNSKSSNPIINKINKIAAKFFRFRNYLKADSKDWNNDSHAFITSGMEKRVYQPKENVTASHGTDKVFYAPVVKLGGLINKRNALRKEIEKMSQIKQDINESNRTDIDTTHLALDARVVQKDERILGQYTVEVDKAESDFECFLSQIQGNLITNQEETEQACPYPQNS